MSVARRSLQVVAFICTLLVGVTSMAVIVTQTTWFKEWLRGFIVRQAEDYVNGRLSIGRLDGNLFTGIELGDIDVTMNGKHVVDVDEVGLQYNPVTLIKGDVVLDHIRLDRPKLVLERTTDGWNLAHLIKARTPDNRYSISAELIGDLIQTLRGEANRLVPGCGNQLPTFLVTNQRSAQSSFVIYKRMCEATFDAKEFAVQSVHITITGDYAH